jgi:hypothetical protein
MKKWMIILFLLPSLSMAKPNVPWENIPPPYNGAAPMYRMSVPHGWLIYIAKLGSEVVFYPDENHEWVLETN